MAIVVYRDFSWVLVTVRTRGACLSATPAPNDRIFIPVHCPCDPVLAAFKTKPELERRRDARYRVVSFLWVTVLAHLWQPRQVRKTLAPILRRMAPLKPLEPGNENFRLGAGSPYFYKGTARHPRS